MEGLKTKYVLLLPLNYNDGRAVPQNALNRMLDEVFVLAGGYSIAGTVKGAYRMSDGTKQEDDSLQIWIGVRDQEVPELEEMVARFGKTLGQETMYLKRTGGTIGFIAPLD
jgi:hypothetical protein